MDYLTALRSVTNWGPTNRTGTMDFIERAGPPIANETGVTISLKSGGAHRCLYKDTPNAVVARKPLAKPPTAVTLDCQGTSLRIWDTDAANASLVAAWNTLSGGLPTYGPEKAAAFEAEAGKYRADPAAFVLPEEARAFKVQAETAVREKRLWDAADRFGKGIDISLAWAAGRYNLALVYGELELPRLAIAEMNRYLQLAPDSENARAAQDKIYVWQDKANR